MREIARSTFALWAHPIMSAIEDKYIGAKLIIAGGFSFINSVLSLIDTPIQYILFIVLLLVLDFLSGITKAWRNGEKISSFKMRATIVKFVEFTIFLLAVSGLVNAFSIEGVEMVGDVVQSTAFFIVCVIEITSIVENLGAWARGAWNKIASILSDRVTDISDISNVDKDSNSTSNDSESDKG